MMDTDESSRSGSSKDSKEFQTDSTTASGNSTGPRLGGHVDDALALRETKWLRYSKMIFLLILVIAAALSTFAVYRVSKNDEDKAYRTRFQDFANEVITVSELHASSVVEAYDSLALTITSSVNASAWPNVVVPGFEGLAQNTMKNTDANFVTLTPFVYEADKTSYELFVLQNAPQWIQEGADFAGVEVEPQFVPFIFDVNEDGDIIPGVPRTTSYSPDDPYYYVVHQAAPVEFLAGTTNFNGFAIQLYYDVHDVIVSTKRATLAPVQNYDADPDSDPSRWPTGYLGTPIYRDMKNRDEIVGILTGSIGFQAFLGDLLPEEVEPLYAVIQNTCNQTLTYYLDGPDVTYLGTGDRHESRTEIKATAEFQAFETLDTCRYSISIHPSTEFYDEYHSNQPVINAVAIGLTFVVTAIIFILYDILVERRQKRVLKTANRSVAIVSSLFPTNVRDRLLREEAENQAQNGDRKRLGRTATRINSMNPTTNDSDAKSKPIADLFPHATVLFADIVGFTAWSSMREPTQVFELLENIYSAFDKLAKKLGVFKVETIGDCYVAACGLPEPMVNHASTMTRFAKLCMSKMEQVVVRLAPILGPDTSNLTMRMGIHSGPVTAGVLRGEKSRFQLFGDTMNTASRIESTGMAGRIQISQETADELVKSGKDSWMTARDDMIEAKGKGRLQTYWVFLEDSSNNSNRDGSETNLDADDLLLDDGEIGKNSSAGSAPSTGLRNTSIAPGGVNEIEVAWNADVFKSFLKKIIAARNPETSHSTNPADLQYLEERHREGCEHIYALDEVKEVIRLPNKPIGFMISPDSIHLSPSVQAQVDDYILTIGSMYRNNPFHNFAHASHVVQSTMKLLNRIVTVGEIDYGQMAYRQQSEESRHKFSYGITSDPITQFACIFAALIHDVDHCGVPNSQLVKEKTRIADTYNNKSVAEQNSLDLAWDLLMDDQYTELRSCIYTNESEFQRFRQLLVNMVMATDIMDKDLKDLRNCRWDKAFKKKGRCGDFTKQKSVGNLRRSDSIDSQDDDNRMATIVIEHLIQASDVAHTMQHWHVYTRWNERLFHEMYKAFKMGRADSDPSASWYEGELGFFDFYIIPLAKKLQECKIFGVSSDEYLNYAQANRKEWEIRGRDMVEKYLETYTGPY